METRDDMEFLCLWTSPSNMNDEKNLCDVCAAEQDKSLWNQHWNALQLDGFLVFAQCAMSSRDEYSLRIINNWVLRTT
ncbi:hypothetical protein TURU_151209 [Turdus rufiventris]|nr:hypothetical protein TURU_151209 [Turdus rufiventris]